MLKRRVWRAAKKVGIAQIYEFAKYRFKGEGVPPPGTVRFGDLRRLEPMSREYGYDRGLPVDRYYIEKFLKSQSHLIQGRVLEIGERLYTEMLGTGVTQSDMLHVIDHPEATYVDDLTDGKSIPDSLYDCVILTQTLHLIFDMEKAIATLFRILKPGGVVLCTVPGITQIADAEWNDTWYWSLSQSASRKLFGRVFDAADVSVTQQGNVLSAISFLQGLSYTELKTGELDHFDEEYPVTIGILARAGAASKKGASLAGATSGG
ncbi:MAG: methyltransferase [Sphingobium sp.]|nr:methyltransferase [Sphingobium sp.]